MLKVRDLQTDLRNRAKKAVKVTIATNFIVNKPLRMSTKRPSIKNLKAKKSICRV